MCVCDTGGGLWTFVPRVSISKGRFLDGELHVTTHENGDHPAPPHVISLLNAQVVQAYSKPYVDDLCRFDRLLNGTFEEEFYIFTSQQKGLFLGWVDTAGGLCVAQHQMVRQYMQELDRN